ncbi:CoA ester lyase [Antrihabitans sp. YC2-6]|uniref:HpcH/HpaI aldolase/citrate lyase family protein n=1 Tax=Antrihabitans sp. YC2-6 TaxID=2799498 RepID=UPI0018F67C3F|nr:CoA ester lyase [Antrihabitans sp. YC2-6]MBJ8348365.1 CoA ester lyase [Antrihabitans sp. YC2-6]
MNTSATWLFVPGDRPERFDKAAASGADEVVIDLEDAVAVENKTAARQATADWLVSGQAWVRINAYGTEWYDDDVAAILATPGLRGVMVPKAEDAQHLSALAARLRVGIVALVESALGIHNAFDLAAAEGVERLAFGSIDFAVDIDATEDDQALLLARNTLVLASRVAGLPAPIDGVTVATRDADAISAAAGQARKLGFGGKLCIHPAQIDPAASAFRPREDEIAWARKVVETFDGGAARLDGQMIDLPVRTRAERLLARAES